MKRHSLTLAVLLGITTMAQAKNYDLPSAPLGITLSRIAADAGITLSFDPAIARGKTTSQIKGDYTPQQVLKMAIAGTGLQLVANGEGNYRLVQPGQAFSKKTDSGTLDPINVRGDIVALDGVMTDQQAYDAVYDNNYSTDYTGKERIDSFRGTDPADLLQSFAGIYSGDARNSGAIDPNIRGMQGEGRIAVRIDGTEQALTVYRGYNGASNRNYIDPLLTGGIQVIKDSGLDTGVPTGIGGGIQIRTINASDFIGKEGGFGGEIRIESASNATTPRIGTDYDGEKLVNLPHYELVPSGWSFRWKKQKSPFDQTHNPKSNGDMFNPLGGHDYAGRIALGYKGDNWDVMGAYAKRKRGNYFSGKHNKEYFNLRVDNDPFNEINKDIIRTMTHYYPAGSEVFNSSNEMTSYLFKAGWQPTEDQSLRLNLRRSESIYGEIMPSRIRYTATDERNTQWPLSKIGVNAYSLQYHLNPKDNRWLNLNANLWRTDANSHLYNSGGDLERVDDNDTWGKSDGTGWDDDILQNHAAIHTKHTRKGFDLSNRMGLSDTLDLTLSGSFQKENLKSNLRYWPNSGWTQVPREGRRQEYSLGFNFTWQPNDRFSADIGAKYGSYWIFDDFLDKHINDKEADGKYVPIDTSAYYKYYTKTPEEIKERVYQYSYDYNLDRYNENTNYGKDKEKVNNRYDGLSAEEWAKKMSKDYEKHLDYAKNNWEGKKHLLRWMPDEKGNFSRADNPCYNGTIDNIPYLIKGGHPSNAPCQAEYEPSVDTGDKKVEKRSDHKWVPSIALQYRTSDNGRIYARYNESVRFPSSFEGLIGFGGTRRSLPLRPEHSRKFELGYVHNLLPYLPNAEAADVKVAYYQNKVKDVIDRIGFWQFSNLEEQKIRGLELQARYDSGKFFGDIGLNYQLQNDICDESSVALWQALRDGTSFGDQKFTPRPSYPRCLKHGFVNGFSLTRSVPDFSAKLHLGGRFLDRKLEMGTRMTYFTKMKNKDHDYFKSISTDQMNDWLVALNPPYGWDKTFVLDAYARYKFNDNFSVELSGTNLTDRYYSDPSTRTAIPSPGRTVKLSFTGRF